MTDHTDHAAAWPDLTVWHPLPEGGTIPKGMRYAALYAGDLDVSTATRDLTPSGASPYHYRTERPVPAPLPTEEGARIIACDTWGVVDLALTKGGWRTEAGALYDDNDITRWMPATEWRER